MMFRAGAATGLRSGRMSAVVAAGAGGATAPPVPTIDLALLHSITPAAGPGGAPVNVRVDVVNNGPATGTNVVVTDALPPGYRFIAAVTSAGHFVPESGRWHVGTLRAGGSQTMTLTALRDSDGVDAVRARVSAVEYDVDLANNASAPNQLSPTNGWSDGLLMCAAVCVVVLVVMLAGIVRRNWCARRGEKSAKLRGE
ncbi:DUF11 domain-containing protein [Tahibacter amnicola]|uniref:DUF11 domain-containing protein n=1 Tax=Tahibacter amnicola TaxID=2976241 RepID=A0ABY6BIR9_9GAMM|nr:DUF11 domain-containing protein [Tahibacter amnicola]UXI69764.1 DUF11 domain-containing protein [Tahibacter amnicola]